jgi:hypothetical protein
MQTLDEGDDASTKPARPCSPLTQQTPGESFSACTSRSSAPSMAFTLISGARHSLHPTQRAGPLTTPQASLNATDRSIAPPEGLSTLGFDPIRFQTEPPACYRATWQLPGPDSHRQATTSLRPKITYNRSPPVCWARESSRLAESTPALECTQLTRICRARADRCAGRWRCLLVSISGAALLAGCRPVATPRQPR